MELSQELTALMESGKKIELRKVSDDILFEMLAYSKECKIDDKKGTSAFQEFFNLDLSYTSAAKEPELRGYKNCWVKDAKSIYDTTTGKLCNDMLQETIKEETDNNSNLTDKEFMQCLLMGQSEKPQRMYVRAYPETIKKIKEISNKYAHGIKGIVEAKIIEDGINAVASKY